jgi:hypothetical protein
MILQIYLKFEQSSGDPARVQVLYERAITDFPIASDLWLDYTRYLDKTLKVFPLNLLISYFPEDSYLQSKFSCISFSSGRQYC